MSKIFLLISFLSLAASCEGVKMLTVQNGTAENLQVTLRSDHEGKEDFMEKGNDRLHDSTVMVVPPDSSIQLVSVFGGMMWNTTIKPRDLSMDYLRLETPQMTIVAKSKKEIIQLIYKAHTDQLQVRGRNLVTMKIGA